MQGEVGEGQHVTSHVIPTTPPKFEYDWSRCPRTLSQAFTHRTNSRNLSASPPPPVVTFPPSIQHFHGPPQHILSPTNRQDAYLRRLILGPEDLPRQGTPFLFCTIWEKTPPADGVRPPSVTMAMLESTMQEKGTYGIRKSQSIERRADVTARDWVFGIGCCWLQQSKANAMIQITG